MNKNTKHVWDGVWKESLNEDLITLKNEEKSVRWKRINKILEENFETIKELRVLEIGGGIGLYSVLLAKLGAHVTILDYSEEAIKRAKSFFKLNNVKGIFINDDAFYVSKKHYNSYDIVMSFGLTEHFQGKRREIINLLHVDLLKKDGLAIISVPNKYNLPYQFYKYYNYKRNTWQFGEEYPYSKKEITQIFSKVNYNDLFFTSDSFLWSLNFFFSSRRISNFIKSMANIGTPLDTFFSYSLIAVIRK